MTRTATVVMPTTGDRGPLLPLAVGSVLRQTVADVEIFIIGDGVSDATRQIAQALTRQDARVRFFDRPKHPRRGEIYRHEALQEAQGRIITYLCDRDLYLPTHLERLTGLLAEADVAMSNFYYVRRDGRLVLPYLAPALTASTEIILSGMAHTRDYYRTLPHGWRTTPAGTPTDQYMWAQLLGGPGCRAVMNWLPTLLYVKRDDHPGWSTGRRYAELALWAERIADADGWQRLETEVLSRVIQERNYQRLAPVTIKGRPPRDWPGGLLGQARRWWERLTGSPAAPAATEIDWPAPIRSGR